MSNHWDFYAPRCLHGCRRRCRPDPKTRVARPPEFSHILELVFEKMHEDLANANSFRHPINGALRQRATQRDGSNTCTYRSHCIAFVPFVFDGVQGYGKHDGIDDVHDSNKEEPPTSKDNTVSITNKERWCQTTKNDDTYTWAISNSANTMSNRST
jgi:hypothetical protein